MNYNKVVSNYLQENPRKGQSLIEVLVAIGIGALLVGSASLAIAFVLSASGRGKQLQFTSELTSDMLNKARTFANADWNTLYNLDKGSTTQYLFRASGTTLQIEEGIESVFDDDIRDGMLGYWKMDEITGTLTYDYSNNNYNASSTGDMTHYVSTPTVVNSDCRAGACLDFDTDPAEVILPSNPTITSFTMATWTNVLDDRVGSFFGIRSGTIYSAFGIRNDTLEVEGRITGTSDLYLTVIADDSIHDSDIHHVVFTFNGSTKKGILYVDGVEVKNGVSTQGPTAATTLMRIGHGPGGQTWAAFNGALDEVRFYNRVLTDDEIERIYLAEAYHRYFYVENVCRSNDSSHVITGTPPCAANSLVDPSTQKVTAVVHWGLGGDVQTMSISDFVTRWKNEVFWQTDWDGGIQSGTVTAPTDKYASSTNVNTTSTPGSIRISGL